MTRRLLTTLEAAELVRVAESTVWSWVRRGRLVPVIREPRYLFLDLDVYAAARRRPRKEKL